ncbi:MAG: energy transducer TonB [Bacteroidota bacterium]
MFVRYVVDTLGNVHCARVIKSDNEQLNVKVIEIIKGAKFTPAINRSKKVIALMVLKASGLP